MKKQERLILIIGILMQLLSYFMPFVREDFGYEFFGRGIDALFREGIQSDNWYLFFAFFSPIIFTPILLLFYYRNVSTGMLKFLRGFFLLVLIVPVIGTIALIMIRRNGIWNEGIIGYITWALSFLLLYTAFFLSGNQQLNEEDLITRHLINDE